MNDFHDSFAAGYACLSAWADLLDRINVFPVADGDTGTNLRISLAPLRDLDGNGTTVRNLLARCATGNSGNIAAAFFREFCQAENFPHLAEKAASGRRKAWQSIADPSAGTMLTVFDGLTYVLTSQVWSESIYMALSLELQKAVLSTSQILPELKDAGVVDSGALAMYVFFDGFFSCAMRQTDKESSILDLFAGKLIVSSSFRPKTTDCYCVDAVIQMDDKDTVAKSSIAGLGKSVVVVENESSLKVHLHTPDPGQLRGRLDSFGDVIQWSAEEIDPGTVKLYSKAAEKSVLHIVTDAAGSIPVEMARHHGITLLDSYIIAGVNSRPESLYDPEQVYPLMRKGDKITTAQASTFERHQHYRSICQQFGPSLYLSVGSVFTGNYDTATAWKKENDQADLFTVMDTGAASGRLAIIALLTARHAKSVDSREEVLDFARKIIADCTEFVFIDELKYLVAGGRVSKAGGFFGDLLSMKPVISPTCDGVRKVGVVHSRKAQLVFAMKKLSERADESGVSTIMLQYSDNKEWVSDSVRRQVRARLPKAEILLVPLSLTSGVHMGPGTWSIALTSACSPQPGALGYYK